MMSQEQTWQATTAWKKVYQICGITSQWLQQLSQQQGACKIGENNILQHRKKEKTCTAEKDVEVWS